MSKLKSFRIKYFWCRRISEFQLYTTRNIRFDVKHVRKYITRRQRGVRKIISILKNVRATMK